MVVCLQGTKYSESTTFSIDGRVIGFSLSTLADNLFHPRLVFKTSPTLEGCHQTRNVVVLDCAPIAIPLEVVREESRDRLHSHGLVFSAVTNGTTREFVPNSVFCLHFLKDLLRPFLSLTDYTGPDILMCATAKNRFFLVLDVLTCPCDADLVIFSKRKGRRISKGS